MTPKALGTMAPPLGPIQQMAVRLVLDHGHFALKEGSNPSSDLPLSLAFGSGKQGMTYAVIHEKYVLDFHESYFPTRHAWCATPGQKRLSLGSVGLALGGAAARQCVGCHSVTVSGPGVDADRKYLGVGCESCHGPGSRHIAAERGGGHVLPEMDDLGSWSAHRLNEMCGQCHHTIGAIEKNPMEATLTNRFQPYGLMLSRCYRESGDTLSCLTCHEPHSDASLQTSGYERVCLTCHSAVSHRGPVHGKVCPVNPTSGCIACHMPARPAMRSGGISIAMTDHFIRVFPLSRRRAVPLARTLQMLRTASGGALD